MHRHYRSTGTVLSRAFSRAVGRAFSTSPQEPSGSVAFPLKHVTKSNFESELGELRRHVGAADFVAIDLEMSGVTSAPWRDSFEFDRSDVRYLKVKDSVEKFSVLQFGVCPFRWDASTHSFVAYPYNFYIFPRQEVPIGGPSYEFLCQTTSIDFLARYQFDFNACIHEGISYLSRQQEHEALRRLDKAYEDELSDAQFNPKEVRDIPLNRVADILFCERMKNRFKEWCDVLLRDRNGGFQLQWNSNHSKEQCQTVFFKMRPALSLAGFTSHQFRLIEWVISKHFKDLTYVRVDDESFSSQHLVVYTESKDDRDLLMKEVKDVCHQGAEMKIQAAIGFRHVIDLLSSERKLIVGHNCFLDIAHVYSKFFGPLPSTAEEFVSSVNKYFPYIVDTKILLNGNFVLRQRMKKCSTSLSSAFVSLCPLIALGTDKLGPAFSQSVKVDVQVDDTRTSIWNSGAKHEAGYDAFMTGCVFAQACSHLGIDFKLDSPSANLAHNEKLCDHINHLYLSWTTADIIDLSTGNKIAETLGAKKSRWQYPKIVFENIVLIWGFQSKLKAREIKEHISKVFGPKSVDSVYHLDESAIFVQFSKAGYVSDFLVLKETLERSDGPVSVLHPLRKLLEGGSTRAASYEVYKKICSSPISKVLFADQAEAVGIKWKTEVKESKLSVEPQENQSFREGNETTISKSADMSTLSSLFETMDSLYNAEDNQIRAKNF